MSTYVWADAPQSGREAEPRRPAGEAEIALAEFAWSDGIVGIGFFPHEVALPVDWRWERPA